MLVEAGVDLKASAIDGQLEVGLCDVQLLGGQKKIANMISHVG